MFQVIEYHYATVARSSRVSADSPWTPFSIAAATAGTLIVSAEYLPPKYSCNRTRCNYILSKVFAELVLERDGDGEGNGGSYTISEVLAALRRVCLSRAAVPVLCGSSLRGIGVEPLLDSVSTFLPSPLDRPRSSGVIRQPVRAEDGRGAGKKRTRKGGGKGAGGRAGRGLVERRRGASIGAGSVLEVDPLQKDLVAFVFKVSNLPQIEKYD